jgi:hypothetical protein
MGRSWAAAADPEDAVDRLPQPYRMIDKVLGGIVEGAERIAQRRAALRALEAASAPALVRPLPACSRLLPCGWRRSSSSSSAR